MTDRPEIGTFGWLAIALSRLREEVDASPGPSAFDAHPVTLTPDGVKLVKVLAGMWINSLPDGEDVDLDKSVALALVEVSEAGLAACLHERPTARTQPA